MTVRLKIGIQLRFKNPEPWKIGWDKLYQDHLTYAAAVDRLGFDGIFVAEHHSVPSGYNPAPFVALAAIAGVTSRCRIGTQPLLLPLHNPVLAAEQAVAVDIFSGGRLMMCLGAGYRDGDFDAVGIPRNERGARSEEGLAILIRALSGEVFDYEGRFYSLKGVALCPTPLQARLPLQLASRSPAAIRRALRYGIDVNIFEPQTAVGLTSVLQEAAASTGRALDQIGVSFHRGGFIAGSREKAIELTKPYQLWQAQEFAGNAGNDAREQAVAQTMIAGIESGEGSSHTAEEWRRDVEADVALVASTGMRPDWLSLTLWHSGMPVERAIEGLEQFAEQVLPHIAK